MLTDTSPYARSAANLRENGYHVLPVGPGTKVPGSWRGGTWSPMPGWAKFCDAMPPEFVHDGWERWPDAGICIAHGKVIGLDLDTDRQDVAQALHRAVTPPDVRRRGAKGWLGYYRPGAGLDGLSARVRWYDADGGIVVELLLHGTQSVLPPTIHPGTGKPYVWTTPETLEGTDVASLQEFCGADLAALDREFAAIGVTRQAPRRVQAHDYVRPVATDHDLEKPFGRSINDRALEPSALDQWWPAMGLPKTRQRCAGAWEAVPSWRGSGSGRSLHDRNPNLKAGRGGIVDFGADRSYTPVDVVMAWRDCSFEAAVEWLTPYLRPEEGAGVVALEMATAAREVVAAEPVAVAASRDIWEPMPVFTGARSFGRITPAVRMTEAEYRLTIPAEVGEFPIKAFGATCPGLLGHVAEYLDAASVTATQAGGLAVALPLLGAIMGRAYESPTGLRTNVYSVTLGGSGSGKTSLVKPAKELLRLAKADHVLGADRLKSGSGVLKMLEPEQPKILFLDEFGHMLKGMSSPGAGVHYRDIITEFTALYSAANTIFCGSAYATQETRTIDCPHLCLFGMATPDQFWDAFGSGALEDGSVARYLVFPIGETAPKEPDESGSGMVAEGMEAVLAAIAGRVRGNLGRPEVCSVPMVPGAERARLALIKTMDACARYAEEAAVKGAMAILRRVAENAAKIALISAVGRDPVAPSISEEDFAIGHALARWSAVTMVANVASHIADNQYERDVNAVERRIEAAGPGGVMKGKLFDSLRTIRKRDKQEILEGLEDAGKVVSERSEGSMKPGWRVVHRKFRPE